MSKRGKTPYEEAIDGFDQGVIAGGGYAEYSCIECGAQVIDCNIVRHAKWHAAHKAEVLSKEATNAQ